MVSKALVLVVVGVETTHQEILMVVEELVALVSV
jgi:hypothetical protein|tara:strand:+ start:29 stop:130 length:102 start_codon:yes stop_codon:yes gene_type:complete